MTLRIVTDSTADFDADEAAALGVTIVPLTVFFGEEAFLDRVEVSPEQFYQRLRASKTFPRTSQPSVGQFQIAFEQLAAEGATEILSIHVSSRLSGTLNSARLAASSLTAPVRVSTLDSLTVAGGLNE